MPLNEKFLTYRGDLQAIAGHETTAFFVTVHSEKQPTALYALNAEKVVLVEQPLPAGGRCLVVETDAKNNATIWIGGSDAQLYRTTPKDKKPKAIGRALESPITSLALLADNRIAVLTESVISILARKDGKVLQSLELPENGTQIAADPSGEWLVAGTSKGMIFVFECEDKPEFLLSESDKLHEAAVTAILFEPEELRFFSAGSDQKLLLTHARGALEPEDRGRSNNHNEPITSLLLAPGERFISGSQDRTLKSWTRAGASRPATTKDGVACVVDLGLVSIHNRSHLVVACDDDTLRFFLLDAGGKVGDLSIKVSDAYARAENELSQKETTRRETALKDLASYGDTQSLEIIAKQISQDGDHAVRTLATTLVADSGHPRAVKILEGNLKHKDEAVRRAALAGLLKSSEAGDLRPLDLALDANKADIGCEAISELEKLAKKDDRAMARLEKALDRSTREVRRAALMSLESVHAKTSPDADLIGLKSKHGDLRRLVLVRLFQRKLLDQARVQSALRRSGEDGNADVRRTAFLVSLFTRAKLADAIRARDQELHRQLYELETFTLEEEETKPGKGKGKKAKEETKEPELPKTTIKKLNLAPADYEPLLQAMASRVLDTCLLGGRCLALLGDPRAFGLLLQLSRENDKKARVDVCRALANLNDSRAVDRLRTLLNDEAGEVRDAAFTALAKLYESNPLEAAEAGLNADHEDVRRRGLEQLIAVARDNKPKTEEDPVAEQLVRALNDSYPNVRSEAFKACLNQKIAGGNGETLRFILNSIHADVRREVLTEVMANIKHKWAEELLLELYNDPDPKLRKEAFDFAVKKAKGSDYGPMIEGLGSTYSDIRLAGVRELVRKRTKKGQVELIPAISDSDLQVRQAALEALVHADAEEALTQAMENHYIDVRLRAAAARARMGDEAALKPLVNLVSEPEPQEKEKVKAWTLVVKGALKALGDLGDAAAFDAVGPHLESKEAGLRQAAAEALVGMATPQIANALKPRLQHSDPEIQHRAALGLAYCGDSLGTSLVFSELGASVLSEIAQLTAAVALGEAAEDRIASFLDADDESLRMSALIVMLSADWKKHDGTPKRCLAGLSSRHPRVRLIAARALEHFPDSKAFSEFLITTINDQGDEAAWTISQDTVSKLADVLCFSSPFLQARAVALLPLLKEDKQHAWDLAWSVFEKRFAEDLKTVQKNSKKHKLPKLAVKAEEVSELAFGTYVGLVREASSSHSKSLRIRQTALRRLAALAEAHKSFQASALPVQIQALGDPNQPVRIQAFEQLRELGLPAEQLGAEAIESGHTDLGVKGLNLITEGATPAAGRKVLENVMTSRTDNLALEAARILRESHDPVEIAAKALEAIWDRLRMQAVNWLSADYQTDAAEKTAKDQSTKAQKQLVAALGSRYREVRKAAAIELARKKDASAFDALIELLQEKPTAAIIGALETLGDNRTPDAFLDRVENDPTGEAPAKELIKAAGRFRQKETADRLLKMMETSKSRYACHEAVWCIAGFDQPNIELNEMMTYDELRGWTARDPIEIDTAIDPDWEKKQHPRYDDVLARLMEKCLELGEANSLKYTIEQARWSRGKEVDPILAVLASHSDDSLRRDVVQALGWRLKHRDGSPDSLLKALEHRDPQTKFLAAEGLAKSGRNEGVNVLLSAIDLMDDYFLRQRAVLALGELADERALDVLLRLAQDDEQIQLQEVAAEALGHLGQSEKAEDIFKLLERFVKTDGSQAEHALRGLRYFNTPSAWKLIREKAANQSSWIQEIAVELLAENDDPATCDLVLKLLREDGRVWPQALQAAQKLFGADSLEPNYAVLQNGDFWMDDPSDQKILDRICSEGEPSRIMEIVPNVNETHRETLAAALLNWETLPVEEAADSLSSSKEDVVDLAAHILGRAGSEAGKQSKAIATAIQTWRAKWDECRQERTPPWGSHPVERVTSCLTRLIWAAGRMGAAPKELVDAAESNSDDRYFRSVRLAAIRALAHGKANKQILDLLEAAATGPDPEVRAIAAQTLSEQDPKRATAMAEKMLSDRVSLERLAFAEKVDITPAMHTAAESAHYQGVALPLLIAAEDFDHLKTVAHNRDLPEVTRLGAIESLASLGQEAAEEELATLGKNEKEEEDFRKAAWRAHRRSKRQRLQTTS